MPPVAKGMPFASWTTSLPLPPPRLRSCPGSTSPGACSADRCAATAMGTTGGAGAEGVPPPTAKQLCTAAAAAIATATATRQVAPLFCGRIAPAAPRPVRTDKPGAEQVDARP